MNPIKRKFDWPALIWVIVIIIGFWVGLYLFVIAQYMPWNNTVDDHWDCKQVPHPGYGTETICTEKVKKPFFNFGK